MVVELKDQILIEVQALINQLNGRPCSIKYVLDKLVKIRNRCLELK